MRGPCDRRDCMYNEEGWCLSDASDLCEQRCIDEEEGCERR